MKIALPIVTLERIAHTLPRMPNKEKPAPLNSKGAAPRCHPRPIAEVVCYSSAPTSRKNISAPPATPVPLWYDPISVIITSFEDDGVFAWYPCENQYDDVSTAFYNGWSSGAPSVVTVDYYGTHNGVAVGSTTSQTYGVLQSNNVHLMCPTHGFTPSGTVNVAKLSCTPTSVARGGSVTCSVSGAPTGATFSGWKFTDSNSNTVTSSQTNSSWPGTMVMGGTVSVQVSASGSNPTTLTASVTVTARTNFAFTAVSPTLEPNNSSPSSSCTLSVPSPPVAGGLLGQTCLNVALSVNDAVVNDSGPNQGYHYVTSVSSSYQGTPTAYYYVISPDLSNTSSAFYQAQTGTYNAQTNPNGYISGANLLSDTIRHESGTLNSHYQNYVTVQNNPTNNLGVVAEAETGPPSQSTPDFEAKMNSDFTTATNSIKAGTNAEPCGSSYVGYDATCTFQGYVNFNF